MTQKLIQNRTHTILLVGVTLLLLAALMLPLFAAAQEGELPPRGGNPPTATPVPTETPEPTAEVPPQNVPTTGSRLQLHLHYGPNWPWHLMAWQDLWTEVQWSDGTDWYVVEGWRGQMDNIAQQDGHWVSLREWWVDSKDLGDGPFRWLIYDHQGGAVLATSETFMLPPAGGQTMVINQTVGE